jgi:hypothetical protein
MKYAVETSSGLIKVGSGIQKLMGIHRYTDGMVIS